MTKVAAIDDHGLVREGLSAWLTKIPDLELAYVGGTVEGYLSERAPVDVILLDANLGDDRTPAYNVRRLVGAASGLIVLSSSTDSATVLDVIEAGANGYVTKSDQLERLAAAIRVVAAGGSYVSSELAFAIANDERPTRPRLSPQELNAVRYYAAGKPLKTVARNLAVSEDTARDYLARACAKYTKCGRPTVTKIDIAKRAWEDGIA